MRLLLIYVFACSTIQTPKGAKLKTQTYLIGQMLFLKVAGLEVNLLIIPGHGELALWEA